jgi:MoaA/NifB/PqqE/SkfB family radical SAM enzyme
MSFELFREIVDQCVELGVNCIKPHGYGEPLLTTQFDKHISYIRQKSSFIKIILVTNGSLLDDEWAKFFIEQEIDQINISIDGTTKNTYENIRRNCDFERVVANTRNLIERKRDRKARRPVIVVRMIRMVETEAERPLFAEIWEPLADEVIISNYITRAGSLAGTESRIQKDRSPCFRLWKQLVVCSNGEAALCCADWNCETPVGDLKSRSLQEVWTGRKINVIRESHLRRKAEEIPICSRCDPEVWDSMPEWWYKSSKNIPSREVQP